MNEYQNIKTVNWLIVLAGLWLILAPFFLGFSGTILSMNDVITGVVIAMVSLVAIGLPEDSKWINWISALLGVWIFITPFFMALVGTAGMWNNLIVGSVTIILGIWGTMSISSPSSSSTQMPKAV